MINPPDPIAERPARQDQKVIRLARNITKDGLQPRPEGGYSKKHNFVKVALRIKMLIMRYR